MLTLQNMPSLLKKLGFIENKNVFTKDFGDIGHIFGQ